MALVDLSKQHTQRRTAIANSVVKHAFAAAATHGQG